MADEKFEILDGFVSRSSSNVDGTLTSTQLVITGNVAVDTDTFIVDSTNDRVGINKVPASGAAFDVNGTVRATSFSGNGALLTSLDVANIPDLADSFLSSKNADSYESGTTLSISNNSTLQVTSGTIKLSDNQTLTFGNGGDAILDLDSASGDFIISANSNFVRTRVVGNFIPNRNATSNAIAIGYYAGRLNQNDMGVAIGYQAGETNQGISGVAIGRDAGETDQGEHSIAIGHLAGTTRQGDSAIAMGYYCADTDQGNYAIAMGYGCLANGLQGIQGVAIGRSACDEGQGTGSIAIGGWAGYHASDAQGAGGIIFNASRTTNSAGAGNMTTNNHVLIKTDETTLKYDGGANTGWTLSIPSSNNESTTNAALSIVRSASSNFYNFNPTMLRFQAEDGSTYGPNGGGDFGNTTFVQDVYNGMTIRNEGDPWNLFEGKVTIRAGSYSANTQEDVMAFFSASNYMPYHSGSNFGALYVKGLEMDDSIRTYKLAANSIVLQSGSQYGMVDGNFRIHANTSYYGTMYCVSSVGFRIRGGINTPISIQSDDIDDGFTVRSPGNDKIFSAMCSAYSNSYAEMHYGGDVRFRTTSNGIEVVKAGYGTQSEIRFSDEQSPSLPADIRFNSFGNGNYYPTNSGGLQYSAAGHYFADTSVTIYNVPGFWCLMNGDMTIGTSSGNTTPLTEFLFDVSNGFFHSDGNQVAYSSSTNSDLKMKKNVSTLTGALDKVSSLRGVEFDWKEEYRGESSHDIGLIAQEVETIIPEVVSEYELRVGRRGVTKQQQEQDDSLEPEVIKSVDYAKLTALLIEAVKELKAQVDALQS